MNERRYKIAVCGCLIDEAGYVIVMCQSHAWQLQLQDDRRREEERAWRHPVVGSQHD